MADTHSQKVSERERDRVCVLSSICWFTPQGLPTARTGPDQSGIPKVNAGLPHTWQGPRELPPGMHMWWEAGSEVEELEFDQALASRMRHQVPTSNVSIKIEKKCQLGGVTF